MDFSERLAAALGAPIDVDGQTAVGIYKRAVQPNERFDLRFVHAREQPLQGVHLKLRTGSLEVAGQQLKDPVLWRDTAPSTVSFRCLNKKPSELLIWNCWKDERGVSQAWIGNAAMIVKDESADRVHFRCNSRYDVTFEDLVFELATREGQP